MNDEEKGEDKNVCSTIEHAKTQAQIEHEREERRFKHRMSMVIVLVISAFGFLMLSGSMYGWLFLGKEFLDGPMDGFFDTIGEALKILFG